MCVWFRPWFIQLNEKCFVLFSVLFRLLESKFNIIICLCFTRLLFRSTELFEAVVGLAVEFFTARWPTLEYLRSTHFKQDHGL